MSSPDRPAPDFIQAWQCIGCGKLEAPQPCIGVCRDRKVLMVGKDDYEALATEHAQVCAERDALKAILVQLAWSQPREGQWESCWRALQEKARRWIADPGGEVVSPGPSHGA